MSQRFVPVVALVLFSITPTHGSEPATRPAAVAGEEKATQAIEPAQFMRFNQDARSPS